MEKQHCTIRRGRVLRTGGFSFIELTISIGIFAMLTGMLTFGYGSLNSRVNVDTLAHNIGQWVREAQISSMGVKRDSTGNFPPGYGLHFSTQSATDRSQFIYFHDTNNNKLYDAGEAESNSPVTLLQGYTVSQICGEPGGATLCGVAGQTNLAFADITFARPEPDAVITGPSGTYSPVRIIISSPKGINRAVVVYATGQVSIQAAP